MMIKLILVYIFIFDIVQKKKKWNEFGLEFESELKY